MSNQHQERQMWKLAKWPRRIEQRW